MTDDELLAQYATERLPGRWEITPGYTYSRDHMVTLIRTCLALGVEPTDTVTVAMFAAIVARLVAVEERLQAS